MSTERTDHASGDASLPDNIAMTENEGPGIPGQTGDNREGYFAPQEGRYDGGAATGDGGQSYGTAPAYGQPTSGQPAYGQPAYGQPGYGQPGYGQPNDAQPS
jgi:hypothetical protein